MVGRGDMNREELRLEFTSDLGHFLVEVFALATLGSDEHGTALPVCLQSSSAHFRYVNADSLPPCSEADRT